MNGWLPNIRRTKTGLPIRRGEKRRTTMFLTEESPDEIRIQEIDPKTGKIIETSRMSRQAYTDEEALRVYVRTRRRSRREAE